MRDKQREETRRRLYRAALEVFRRDGVAGCRIDDIAKLAEVSRAAFYFHFATKDDVLIELTRESEEPVARAVTELPDGLPLPQVLMAVTKEMAAYWQNEPSLLPDIAAVSLRHAAMLNDREAKPVRVAVGHRFAKAVTRGELSSVLPPEVLADFFLVNCLAAMVAWSGAPVMPLEVVLAGVAQLFLNGAKP